MLIGLFNSFLLRYQRGKFARVLFVGWTSSRVLSRHMWRKCSAWSILKPFSPLVMDTTKTEKPVKDDKNPQNPRPFVGSTARRTALWWSKPGIGKSSDRKENVAVRKENLVGTGTTMTWAAFIVFVLRCYICSLDLEILFASAVPVRKEELLLLRTGRSGYT